MECTGEEITIAKKQYRKFCRAMNYVFDLKSISEDDYFAFIQLMTDSSGQITVTDGIDPIK